MRRESSTSCVSLRRIFITTNSYECRFCLTLAPCQQLCNAVSPAAGLGCSPISKREARLGSLTTKQKPPRQPKPCHRAPAHKVRHSDIEVWSKIPTAKKKALKKPKMLLYTRAAGYQSREGWPAPPIRFWPIKEPDRAAAARRV